MRIEELKSLTQDELAFILYVIDSNKLHDPNELLWYSNEVIVWKLSQEEHKLNDEGKKIFLEVLKKLQLLPRYRDIEKIKTFNNTTNGIQLEFSF